jgi:Rieske Fe-S protein
VRAIDEHGGRLFANTAHVAEEERDGAVLVTTEAGPVIRAGAAVFATNSPTNNKVEIHAKQIPARTYVIAGPVPKGSVTDALVWDTYRAYHYVRIQPLGGDEDLLIVGGGDHRTGEANNMEARLAGLEAWTRERYPGFSTAAYRWSGQVLETIDYLPFSGRNPGSENIYIHTGDSGQGMTNGVAGSLTLLPLILGENSRYASIFDPGRKTVTSASAVGALVRGHAGAVKNFAEYIGPGEIRSPDELGPGEGALMRSGIRKLAVFKAADGTVVELSAACPHLGCLVHWNSFEQCWDCPCHGSQFAPDGSVLNGPAVKPLASGDGH